MKNGFEILWTDAALNELEQTINYLRENWTDKELRILALKLEDTLNLISQNPKLFQVIEVTNKIRRVVILSHNTLYYKIKNNQIEIISFFSNRQNPNKRPLK